jgi:O-antigen/teichoic acid export membrane protein
MIPIYTHYLSTADYGTLELLELVSYIAGHFLGMGLGESVFRMYYNYEEMEKKKLVLSTTLITVWTGATALMVALILFSKSISVLVFESPDYYRMLIIVFVTLVINLGNNIPMGLLRIEQKSVLFVVINFVRLVLTLTLNIVFIIVFEMGVFGILLSGLIVSFLAGIYLLHYICRKINAAYSFQIIKEIFKYSLPIMWSWVGMFILHFGDRFLLQRLMSLSDVGIYSLAYKFGMLPNFIILNPFLLLWAPKRFELMQEKDAREIYRTVFTYFIFIQLFISLGISVLIKDAIFIMADQEYHSAYLYVPVILLGYIMFGVFKYVDFGIHVEKKTKILAWFTMLGVVFNIGANFFLISYIGIWGAAITTLATWLLLSVIIYFPAQKLYRINYDFGRIIKMLAIAVILYIVGISVNPASITFSIIIKILIVLTFPFILYLIKFYTDEELTRLAEIFARIKEFLGRKLLKRNSNATKSK